jgi:hypothetical protein
MNGTSGSAGRRVASRWRACAACRCARLLDGTASFQAAHDKVRMKDPAVLQQRAKIHLVRDEKLADLLPVRVTIDEIGLTEQVRLRLVPYQITLGNLAIALGVLIVCLTLFAPVPT